MLPHVDPVAMQWLPYCDQQFGIGEGYHWLDNVVNAKDTLYLGSLPT